jgi:hypothetical protein
MSLMRPSNQRRPLFHQCLGPGPPKQELWEKTHRDFFKVDQDLGAATFLKQVRALGACLARRLWSCLWLDGHPCCVPGVWMACRRAQAAAVGKGALPGRRGPVGGVPGQGAPWAMPRRASLAWLGGPLVLGRVSCADV